MMHVDDLGVAIAPLALDERDTFVRLQIDDRVRLHPRGIPFPLRLGVLCSCPQTCRTPHPPSLHPPLPSPAVWSSLCRGGFSLHCARRATPASSWGLREQRGGPAALPTSPSPRNN